MEAAQTLGMVRIVKIMLKFYSLILGDKEVGDTLRG